LRFIAQERLQGKTLKEIGNLFGVIPQTIRNFYERNIKNVTACLKQCVDDKISIWELQHPSAE
jgi:DNA-directed RNA polymerase sigma subunit (sigma70/sigma32)